MAENDTSDISLEKREWEQFGQFPPFLLFKIVAIA